MSSKDKVTILYFIKHDLFNKVIRIFVENPNKRNLLHSCILSLFDMLPSSLAQDVLVKLVQKIRHHANDVFLKKEYEKDFKRFNLHLVQLIDDLSEQESKHKSDRDRSQSRSCQRAPSQTKEIARLPQKEDDVEEDLMVAAGFERKVGEISSSDESIGLTDDHRDPSSEQHKFSVKWQDDEAENQQESNSDSGEIDESPEIQVDERKPEESKDDLQKSPDKSRDQEMADEEYN